MSDLRSAEERAASLVLDLVNDDGDFRGFDYARRIVAKEIEALGAEQDPRL